MAPCLAHHQGQQEQAAQQHLMAEMLPVHPSGQGRTAQHRRFALHAPGCDGPEQPKERMGDPPQQGRASQRDGRDAVTQRHYGGGG